jgi:hypothetical protein
MKKLVASMIALCCSPMLLAGQAPAGDHNPLLRKYTDGEKLVYRMKGVNENWHYTVEADGVVKKDSSGAYLEEYRWVDLRTDGKPVELSAASAGFVQQLTLDPGRNPSMPDLSKADMKLIGPITDMMTFYADLWLVVKTGQLTRAGDHFYFKKDGANSWADGTYVTAGEDAIDFDMTLKSVNVADKTAVVVVKHVVPEKPAVHLPAAWMEKPVADTPNNWVQVMKGQDGKFTASVGKETFDVEMTVSLTDGRILSGNLDNLVQTIDRSCDDAALAQCGEAKIHDIRRKIEITLAP